MNVQYSLYMLAAIILNECNVTNIADNAYVYVISAKYTCVCRSMPFRLRTA